MPHYTESRASDFPSGMPSSARFPIASYCLILLLNDPEAGVLDNPKKTEELLAMVKSAVPFEVEMAPSVVKQLQDDAAAVASKTRYVVTDMSYAGDEGGIVCHIKFRRKVARQSLSPSPTFVCLASRRSRRPSSSIQKHRMKTLKKQRR